MRKKFDKLLKNLSPALHKEKFYFASLDESASMPLHSILDNIHSLVREKEGITIVFTEAALKEMKINSDKMTGPFALISLGAFTDLTGDVGFLSNIDSKLAKDGISLNIISGYYHDHLFVPYEKKDNALKVLESLR